MRNAEGRVIRLPNVTVRDAEGTKVSASPQYQDDGETFVVKAGPEHEILRTNSVGEPVYASPALAGGTIFIRGERHLFAIRSR